MTHSTCSVIVPMGFSPEKRQKRSQKAMAMEMGAMRMSVKYDMMLNARRPGLTIRFPSVHGA